MYQQESQNLDNNGIKEKNICIGERLTTHYICLAWKLGLHPTSLVILCSITSNGLIKWPPN